MIDSQEKAMWELLMKVASVLVLVFSMIQAAYEVLQARAEGLGMYLG